MSAQYDNPNPFLVLVGAPGTGKSTWARKYFKAAEIVSSDRIRAQIGDHAGDQRATQYAFRVLHTIVEGRTFLGKTVVVDATNRTREHRGQVVKPAIGWMRPVFAVVFLTPLDVCLERNARRRTPRRVPEDWVRETHAMIENDFDPSTMWMPNESGFSGVLFVRHGAHGYAGGYLTSRRWAQADWLNCARDDPPEGFRGPGKSVRLHRSAWNHPSRRPA